MKTVAFLLSLFFIPQLHAAPQKISGMYVNTFGDSKNQSLIFIHGGPGFNSHDFEVTTARRLADDGYYVVVYDQRGQGRSDEANPEDFNYTTYSNDLKKIIDQLKLKSPVLLGHSHGGPIAINFDQKFPGVAKSVILLAAPINFWGSIQSIFDNCTRNYMAIGNQQALVQMTYVYYELFANPKPNYERSFLVGSSFIHGIRCGLYNVSNPTPQALALKALLQKNPLKQPLNGMNTAMPGFLKNENYVKGNYTSYLMTQKGRYFAIYASEDGLFTPLQLNLIRTAVYSEKGPSRFRLIMNASHSIFIDQQEAFVNAIKDFTK